ASGQADKPRSIRARPMLEGGVPGQPRLVALGSLAAAPLRWAPRRRWRAGGPACPDRRPRRWLAGVDLAHDFLGLEAEADLELGIFGAIGTVYGVALDAFGKFLSYAAGGGLGRIGGPHHIAVALDGILTLQHLHHDGA